MKRCIRPLAVAFLVSVFAGCLTGPPYDPFVLSRSDIYQRVDTLAMLPLQVPDFDRKEEVSARYEALITERLEQAGFTVIPSREYADIRGELAPQMGDLYDPQTGEAHIAKLDAIRTNSLLGLAEHFNAQAYVLPRVVRVGAHWSGNIASWDGVERPVAGETEGFWEWLAATQEDRSGRIRAMSLRVYLSSMSGETYYVGRGGIHLLSRFRSGHFSEVPRSNWFENADWDVEAVTLAVIGLTGDIEPESTAIPLSADISMPQTFENVLYRATIEPQGAFSLMSDIGTLTVNENSLRFAGDKEDLSILLSEIHKLSYGSIGTDSLNKWVVIEYGAWRSPSYAVMAAGKVFAWAEGSDEMFSTIKYIIKKNNLTVPILQ